MRAPRIGLVDPIRTAWVLVHELQRREIPYVLVESGLLGELPMAAYASTAERSDRHGTVVRAQPSPDATAAQLRALGITHLIGCVDPSILYTDQLCALLGLPFNGLRLSEARRNKFKMNAAIRQAGLGAPWCHEAADLDQLMALLDSAPLPVVVKPVSSGGTDNVHLCATRDQVVAAFQTIHGARNLMGGMNTSVLVQEYVDGTEYIVDSVSFDGQHVPIDFFEYQKGSYGGRSFIYEKERYLRSDDPRSVRLHQFATAALDALEFRWGASHMEVKIDSAGVIRFIEVGPRVCGGELFRVVEDSRADGKSQIDFALDAALGLPPPNPAYETAAYGLRVFLVAREAGRIARLDHLDEIRAMPSVRRVDVHVQVGQVVAQTSDMTNDAGFIDLAHASPAVLAKDEARLDQIIADGVLRFA